MKLLKYKNVYLSYFLSFALPDLINVSMSSGFSDEYFRSVGRFLICIKIICYALSSIIIIRNNQIFSANKLFGNYLFLKQNFGILLENNFILK